MPSSSKPAVSASAAKTTGTPGALERISIEPAKNGFTIMESRTQPRKKNEPYNYVEPERYVFGTAKEAAAYVEKCLTGHEPGEADEK